MSKVFALSSLVLLMAFSALGDCPTVYSVDDPPCTPCQYLPIGPPQTIAIWIFNDGSEILIDIQYFANCSGDSYGSEVPNSGRPYCPNGPYDQCSARDFFFA